MESLGRRTSRTLLLLYLGTFNTTEQLRVKKFNLFTIFVCRILSTSTEKNKETFSSELRFVLIGSILVRYDQFLL